MSVLLCASGNAFLCVHALIVLSLNGKEERVLFQKATIIEGIYLIKEYYADTGMCVLTTHGFLVFLVL